MKRRQLIQYGLLSSSICLSNHIFFERKSVEARESETAMTKKYYDFVFLYWMPYNNVANYTLSSPNILGAPNYYYESLFEFLGQNSDIEGKHIAQKIAEFERSNMYSVYVVTKNNEFSKIIESMNRLIDSILESRKKQVSIQPLNSYMYFGERYRVWLSDRSLNHPRNQKLSSMQTSKKSANPAP